jgi:hypothetical protein
MARRGAGRAVTPASGVVEAALLIGRLFTRCDAVLSDT